MDAANASDAASEAAVAVSADATFEDPILHYHCDARWPRDGDKRAVLEEHDGKHWFCSFLIELESSEPIAILEDHGDTGEGDEWVLSVGGVRVRLRVDAEWANLVAGGWRPAEIERVVYPEVFGRSGRRVVGERVRRETDLIFSTDNILRAHFRYEDLADRVGPVDEMIDRAHVPICAQNWGCKHLRTSTAIPK